MTTRRQFLVGGSAISLLACQTATAQQPPPAAKTAATDSPAPLDKAMVGKFVGKSHGDLDTVRQLLKEQPQLVHACWDWGNGDFETGLNAASHVGRRDIAEFLLENGAKPDAPAMVMLGMKDIVAAMLDQFPRLHATPGAHGIPLLSHAIFGKQLADEVFQLLLESGADVNAKSNMAMTPLMAAAAVGRVSIVDALLEHGADPTMVNSQGETALAIAERRDRTACAAVLRKAESK